MDVESSKLILFTSEVSLKSGAATISEKVHKEELDRNLLFPPLGHVSVPLKSSENELKITVFGGQ